MPLEDSVGTDTKRKCGEETRYLDSKNNAKETDHDQLCAGMNIVIDELNTAAATLSSPDR
eukprot:m.282694 g.282694  ORF g.282694 m.282694 type:complete len:60 (-) comp19408_c0_seq7:1537-1716(-)